MPTTATSVKQSAQKGQQAAYSATAQLAQEGQLLLKADIGQDVIGQIMGPGVQLVDVGAEAAAACRELLSQRDGLACRPQGGASYYTSDRASDFQRLASLFLGEDVAGQVQEIDISKY